MQNALGQCYGSVSCEVPAAKRMLYIPWESRQSWLSNDIKQFIPALMPLRAPNLKPDSVSMLTDLLFGGSKCNFWRQNSCFRKERETFVRHAGLCFKTVDTLCKILV